jgi:two-component system, sensor histidine kinase and response regulator
MKRTNHNNEEFLQPTYSPLQVNETASASESDALHELRNHLAAIEGFAVAIGEGLTEPRMKEYLSGILRNVARCVRVVSILRPPVLSQPPTWSADRVSSEWPVNGESFLSQVPILLVEDDDDVAEVTSSFLRRSGAAVTRVTDGDEVVSAVQHASSRGTPFSLILLDIHMARLNGLEAIKEVRSVDPRIPIVVLTSDNARAVREQSLANGASGFLQKPIEYSTLACFLAAYLGNGESCVSSPENDGTRADEPSAEETSGVGHRAQQRPRDEDGIKSHARRILVVDDNQDSAEAMAMLLERFGYEVSVAFSGEDSMALLQPTPPDVVLLDLELPDMHGTQVAERMRASGFSGKVIALSGHSERAVKERCARAGIDHFVTKPCSVQELRTLL